MLEGTSPSRGHHEETGFKDIERTQEPQGISALAGMGEREQAYLHGIVQGKSRTEIGDELQVGRETVARAATNVGKIWGTRSALSTALHAVEDGVIPPEVAFEGFEEERLGSLTESDIALLDAVIANQGEGRTYKAIADELTAAGTPTTKKAVELHIGRISQKLGTGNKERTAVVYAVAKKVGSEQLPEYEYQEPEKPSLTDRQKSVLSLTAQGLTHRDIAEVLTISEIGVENALSGIGDRQGTGNAVEKILTALEDGDINPEEVLERRDPSILRRLLPDEVELLDEMTATNGKYSSNRELAEALDMNYEAVKTKLEQIREKLGTSNRYHTAAVYRSAQMIPDLTDMTEQRRDLLTREVMGQTRAEMAKDLWLARTTIGTHFYTIYRGLRANSPVEASVIAVNKDIVAPEIVMGNRPIDVVDSLEPIEVRLLEALVEKNGSQATNKELEDKLGTGHRRLEQTLQAVGSKLDARHKSHIAAVYAAAKKLRARES